MKELTLIQNKLKAPKSGYNSFGKYNYRSQEDILEAVKPLLKEFNCSLTVTDEFVPGELPTIKSKATIKNQEGQAEFVEASAGIDIHTKGMSVAQCFGSSSSYARKYALGGLFLIDDTKDDDATNMHGKEVEKAPANKTQVRKEENKPSEPMASIKQKTEIITYLNSPLITQEEKKKAYEAMDALTAERASKAIDYYYDLIQKRSKDKKQPA